MNPQYDYLVKIAVFGDNPAEREKLIGNLVGAGGPVDRGVNMLEFKDKLVKNYILDGKIDAHRDEKRHSHTALVSINLSDP